MTVRPGSVSANTGDGAQGRASDVLASVSVAREKMRPPSPR